MTVIESVLIIPPWLTNSPAPTCTNLIQCLPSVETGKLDILIMSIRVSSSCSSLLIPIPN